MHRHLAPGAGPEAAEAGVEHARDAHALHSLQTSGVCSRTETCSVVIASAGEYVSS